MKLHQDTLVSQPDTISIMRFLKTCTRVMFDADGLVKVWYLTCYLLLAGNTEYTTEILLADHF